MAKQKRKTLRERMVDWLRGPPKRGKKGPAPENKSLGPAPENKAHRTDLG